MLLVNGQVPLWDLTRYALAKDLDVYVYSNLGDAIDIFACLSMRDIYNVYYLYKTHIRHNLRMFMFEITS